MLEPIELINMLIDRLIEFVKGRMDERREVFCRVLQPAFNDLLRVHGDYIKMFEEVERELRERLSEWAGIAARYDGAPEGLNIERARLVQSVTDDLTERGAVLEPLRERLRALARDLDGTTCHDEERAFIESVLHYFGFAHDGVHALSQSGSRLIRSMIKHLGTTNDLCFSYTTDDSPILNIFHRVIEHCRRLWSDVCLKFSALNVLISELH